MAIEAAICPRCGANVEIKPGAAFMVCAFCGASLRVDAGTLASVDVWVCSRCNATSPRGSQFCAQCGEPLAEPCPQCGELVEKQVTHCPKCGVYLPTARQYQAEKLRQQQLAQEQQRQTALQYQTDQFRQQQFIQEQQRQMALQYQAEQLRQQQLLQEQQRQFELAESRRQAALAAQETLLHSLDRDARSATNWRTAGCLLFFVSGPLATIPWLIAISKANSVLKAPSVTGDDLARRRARGARTWSLLPMIVTLIAFGIMLLASLINAS